MARTRLIAGNWKMHKTVGEAEALVRGLVTLGEPADQVLLCPPFTALARVGELLRGQPGFFLGAQNMHWEKAGAYTGEVSSGMLAELGCAFVILGHSERRHSFRETDAEINRKVGAAPGAGLVPVLCVGETREEREAGRAQEVVGGQLRAGLAGVAAAEAARLVLAYEPVWAIGSGLAAGPEDAQGMAAFLRGELVQLWGREAAGEVRILYGGSVTPDNSEVFLGQPDVDGALVGGAALDAAKFGRMYRRK